MSISSGLAAYKLAYEISPISLSGGIASGLIGGVLPMFTLMASLSPGDGGSSDTLNDAFAYFRPLPGSSLIDNQFGKYPFANIQIAANAYIAQPLILSMQMLVPVKQDGYAIKTALMTTLKTTLANHCAQGGTFNVATPSYFYSDLLLAGFHDVSGGQTEQAQYEYRLDFEQPLIALTGATATESVAMAAVTGGLPFSGALTGTSAVSPASIGSSTYYPVAISTAASGIPSYVTLSALPPSSVVLPGA